MSEKPDSDKIQAILTAARKRFGHYGLAKTTMHEIAADVGMSKASLYYYFPDKEHLFIEVLRHEMENFFSEITKVTEHPISPGEKLKQYVELRFSCFKDFLNLGKLASAHFETVRSAFTRINTDFLEREKKIIKAILESGIKAKTFEKMNTSAQSDLFVTVIRSLRILILKQRDDFVLTDEDYHMLKNYQLQFTAVFIKGISVK